jgi:hypothetical protein
VNLVIFTCFTICFGLALGIITCLVDSDIFLFSSIGTLLFCGILLGLAFVVPSRKINVCNLSAVCVVLAISMMLAVQYGVKNSHWGGSVMCGVVVLCFSFWIIFDVQAVQVRIFLIILIRHSHVFTFIPIVAKCPHWKHEYLFHNVATTIA